MVLGSNAWHQFKAFPEEKRDLLAAVMLSEAFLLSDYAFPHLMLQPSYVDGVIRTD